jgi:pimeloyl-ACP methyl ester carboxylesterase
MPILSINGHAIHVEDHGNTSRPAVILLHHGLGSVQAWQEQVPVLLQAGCRVIAYDRWGYGRSSPRPALDLPTFAADVADLRVLLCQLDIPQPALVGHSDGGTLALYYAVQYPEQVSCLVTIAAHIYVEPSLPPGVKAVGDEYASNARFRQALRRVHGEQAEQTFHNWYDGWCALEGQDWDMRPVLAQVACPALVIQGCQDEHATPQHARDLAAAIPAAELWLLEGARHMLPQENAAVFNQELMKFLSKIQEGLCSLKS